MAPDTTTEAPSPVTQPVLRSRLHQLAPTSTWRPTRGVELTMPVLFDLALVDPATGEDHFRFEATVDLVEGRPALVRFVARADAGLDVARLQRAFRWSTPVEVVTRLVPRLIARGVDPFEHEYPVDGFPAAADAPVGPPNRALSDEFLEQVVEEYLAIGRGYARAIALERGVSPRTVVSWIEKARARGILSPTATGRWGGSLVPRSDRTPPSQPDRA